MVRAYIKCAFIWLFCFSLPKNVKSSVLPSLYSADGPVMSLNKTNFDEQISNKLYLLVVNFYASWCGHCKNYAPKYTMISERYKKWNSIIKFAAIDCANSEHDEICQRHHISSLPTLMYFYPNSHPAVASAAHKMETFYNTADFLKGINVVFNNMKNPPSNFPNSELYNWAQLQTLIQKSKNNLIVIGIQNKNIPIGLEIILNFIGIKKVKFVRAEYSELKIKFDHSNLATVFKIVKNLLIPLTSSRNGSETRRLTLEIVKEFGLSVDFETMFPTPSARELDFNRKQALIEHNLQSAFYDKLYKGLLSRVYVEDLESALHYTFFRELPRHAELNDTRKLVLYNFLKSLDRYLPFESISKGPSRFVNRLLVWLSAQTLNHRVLKSADLMDFYKSQKLEQEFTYKDAWVGCKGSAPTLRGYPCGLWTLFHTLTVGMWNRYNPDDSGVSIANPGSYEAKIEALALLFTIREYVRHFFTCSDCARNFVRASSQLTGRVAPTSSVNAQQNPNAINSPSDAVLWLWATHNSVNKRLGGDLSEDPMFPKIQYPPSLACNACVLAPGSSASSVNASSSDPEAANWDRGTVLKYLVNHYGPGNVVTQREMLRSQQAHAPFKRIAWVWRMWKEGLRSLFKSSSSHKEGDLPPSLFTLTQDEHDKSILGITGDIPASGYLSCFFLWAISFTMLILMYSCHKYKNKQQDHHYKLLLPRFKPGNSLVRALYGLKSNVVTKIKI